MAPLIIQARARAGLQLEVCTTGQHRDMLDQVLPFFGIEPDHDLRLMQSGQGLVSLTSAVLSACHALMLERKPDMVLVHGDTTTTMAAGLASFYARIPVAHVEAGLRSGSLDAPWPEELNRKITGSLAGLHFAPTPSARANLLREGIPDSQIHVTGNTGIDALQWTRDRFRTDADLSARFGGAFPFLNPTRRLLLVTSHRRENLGEGLQSICAALKALARRPNVQIIYPVHLNPQVRNAVHAELDGVENIHLTPPLDYLSFVYLLSRSTLVLTDSGGIQEEAPALGKPVLVLRQTTERPELVESGGACLVGTSTEAILAAALRLLDDDRAYAQMAQVRNPFGDGRAAERILDVLTAMGCAGARAPCHP